MRHERCGLNAVDAHCYCYDDLVLKYRYLTVEVVHTFLDQWSEHFFKWESGRALFQLRTSEWTQWRPIDVKQVDDGKQQSLRTTYWLTTMMIKKSRFETKHNKVVFICYKIGHLVLSHMVWLWRLSWYKIQAKWKGTRQIDGTASLVTETRKPLQSSQSSTHNTSWSIQVQTLKLRACTSDYLK